MGDASYFYCSQGCSNEKLELFREVRYRCPRCQGLLEVGHDLDALKATPPDVWKKTFDARVGRTEWPFGSGVWGKKEWVCPEIHDDNITSFFEGNSNLFWAARLGAELGVEDLWIKLCGNSHTGSFKDLGMTVLVSAVAEMRARGLPIQAIACASTGDTSAALAAYAAAANIPSVVFLPENKITPAQLTQPLAHGARVLSIRSDFDGCMALVKAVAEKPESPIYLANSMNPLRIEGQKTVAIEMVQQFDWRVPDWVIIPGGNLGNVSALGAGFDMLEAMGITTKRPRICVAQAERANPLYRSFLTGFAEFEPMEAQETAASAIRIGNPVSIHRAIKSLKRYDGVVEQATEDELHEAAARGDKTGLFNCPHTGVALAALEKLIARGLVERHHRVVVVSTAHGLKFSEFKAKYHGGNVGKYRNQPISVDANADAVFKALGL
ncbi:MAG: threonine synthase [Deltaproteobacteria bacterium]|nr:threonine synthase [Deltaproteobacteria bacterium]